MTTGADTTPHPCANAPQATAPANQAANRATDWAAEAQRQAELRAWLQAPSPSHSGGDAPPPAWLCDEGQSGTRAHRAHARMLAARVLTAHHPTLAAMLGEDALATLAERMWHAAPPTSGDLAQWGALLPEHLAAAPELRAWPWLADSARLDWARHRCERAADAALDAESLRLLDCPDGLTPADLRLRLHPGVHTLASDWPVVTLWRAHQLAEGDDRDAAVASALAGVRAAGDRPEHAVVWRQPWRAEVDTLTPSEWTWMRGWACPGSGEAPAYAHLAQALDTLPVGFDLGAWLAKAVQRGWLWHVERLMPR